MSTKAAPLDILIEAGGTYELALAWKQPDKTLIDLTGCRARMMFREDYTSPVLFSASTETGHIELGEALGSNIRVTIAATETAGFAFSGAIYDMEIVFADGVTVRRLIQGRVSVSPEVTYD